MNNLSQTTQPGRTAAGENKSLKHLHRNFLFDLENGTIVHPSRLFAAPFVHTAEILRLLFVHQK
jgi:hypothetical protein